MPINPNSNIPNYCKNCLHRFVCSIISSISEHEKKVKDFNDEYKKYTQSITNTNYICGYKIKDDTFNS